MRASLVGRARRGRSIRTIALGARARTLCARPSAPRPATGDLDALTPPGRVIGAPAPAAPPGGLARQKPPGLPAA